MPDLNSKVYKCVTKFTADVRTVRGNTEIFDRVLNLISCLSKVFGLPDKIRELAEKFEEHESILYNLSKYRDHFIHQAHVFLLGYVIINKIGLNNFEKIFFDSLKENNLLTTTGTNKPDILKTWFLASFFHDVAYAIEKTPILTDKFFKDVLSGVTDTNVPKVTGTFNWGALLAWNDNRYHLMELMKCFYGINEEKKKIIDNALNNSLILKQDHGVFSALILLNQLEEEIEKDPLTFYIAGLSIALHNKFVWENMEKEKWYSFGIDDGNAHLKKDLNNLIIPRRLRNEFSAHKMPLPTKPYKIKKPTKEERNRWVISIDPNSKDKEIYIIKKEDKKLNVCEKIKFDEYPIPFLLMYCDTVQEWGREIEGDRVGFSTELKLKGIDFGDTNTEIVCSLKYENQSFKPPFDKKLEEFIELNQKMWSSKNEKVKFFIYFYDKEGVEWKQSI